MNRWASFFSLFGSVGTLVCCVIPAVFVSLGFGAAFASLVGAVPQIIWISEHKPLVFSTALALIAIAGFFQWKSKYTSCPTDPKLATACTSARRWSSWLYFTSVGFFAVGAFFAFVLPRFI